MTIRASIVVGAKKLQNLSDAPHLDVERLLLHVLGETESSILHAHSERELSTAQAEQLEELLARRATGEPLAYILGEWEFYGRPFWVTPDVLIPRPETENLVDAALAYLFLSSPNLGEEPPPFVIADIGTGSGCIAVTLALELTTHYSLPATNWRIIATDISPSALAIARRNAERHGVADRIEFLEGDMLTPLQDRQIDLIVGNPPYIPSAELDVPHSAKPTSPRLRGPGASRGKIETRGLDFEPRIALDGGPDGQKFVEHMRAAGIPAIVETTGGSIIQF